MNWKRSSYSSAQGNCVEVARVRDGGTAVRDSKDVSGPVLQFTDGAWRAFLTAIREGRLSL
jgi:Domain of unknown function (DUF397)